MHIIWNFVDDLFDQMIVLSEVDVLECVFHPKKLRGEGIVSS